MKGDRPPGPVAIQQTGPGVAAAMGVAEEKVRWIIGAKGAPSASPQVAFNLAHLRVRSTHHLQISNTGTPLEGRSRYSVQQRASLTLLTDGDIPLKWITTDSPTMHPLTQRNGTASGRIWLGPAIVSNAR
jgi:hypothetical protein